MTEFSGNNDGPGESGSEDPRAVSRRGFLKVGVVGGASLLAGRGSSSILPLSRAKSSPPRRGGTLHAAITGGSSADTLDADNAITNMDFARVNNLYDGLVYMNANAEPVLWLAEEITPNSTATEWTVRVKKGVTFHNGKPLTADDVIFTLQRIMNSKAPLQGASALAAVDAAAIKKLDDLTVRVPCKVPFANFVQVLSIWYYFIVPVGYNPHRPIGTGPFMFKSFSPGVQSVFTRNPSYWRHPYPYLDEVVISDFSDETSQVNALLSGQADVVNLLSAGSVAVLKNGHSKVLVSQGGGFTPFTMRVDKAPFNDVRVRQAMRLIVDRPQMLELVFEGHGTIGNDVFGIWAPEYDHQLPQRHQDIEQAKALLKAAGHEGMRAQLVTANIAQGTTLAAQVLAQQAAAAGVTLSIQQVTVTDFYGSNYLKWTLAQDFWYYNYYLPQVASATLPSAPFNETHFSNSRYNSLYAEAQRTLDIPKRYEIEHEMMTIDYDQGGYIIPYFPPVIDGYSSRVNGLVPSKTGLSLNSYNFGELWLA